MVVSIAKEQETAHQQGPASGVTSVREVAQIADATLKSVWECKVVIAQKAITVQTEQQLRYHAPMEQLLELRTKLNAPYAPLATTVSQDLLIR